MTQPPDITAKSWLMVAFLGFVWGGTFLINEVALEELTPFWLATARISFAALAMLVIWVGMGRPLFAERPDGATRMRLALVGALSSALPFMLIAWGQQYVTSGFAGVSMAAIALLVLPLAHFLVPGERMTWRRAAGFVIGFCGVVVLIGGQAFESTGETLEFAGRLACLAAASCYAMSSVQMRKLPAVDPIGLATVLLLIGACIVVPVALLVEGMPPMPSPQIWAIIAFLGIVPTGIANMIRVLVIRSAGPVFMSLTNYQVPVWSVVLGAAFLGEPLPGSLLLALALILCGVGLSQYGALKRLFTGKN
ncbi:DMT family transporter [Marimonas lutisalis]|uniref:DMT family transporter n=1 Tax=Marimonas lutisalis TaxID=2545756 RepID=UPI0010F7CAE7|nr:DMT family transporter [Marimonas lutisalis]